MDLLPYQQISEQLVHIPTLTWLLEIIIYFLNVSGFRVLENQINVSEK